MNDYLWFGVLPYVSLVVFFLVTIRRYRMASFSYSSLSSQFLENQQFMKMLIYRYKDFFS